MTEQSDAALYAAAPAKASEVVVFVERISRVWRTVKNDEAWKAETSRYITEKHLTKLACSDFDAAFDLLIKYHPMTMPSGGLANPPSVRDIAGCLMDAAKRRAEAGPRTEPPTGPRRLLGMPCPKCMGPRDFLPREDFIYCQSCNTAWPRGDERLEFADPPQPTPEEIAEYKAVILRAARVLGEKGKELADGAS